MKQRKRGREATYTSIGGVKQLNRAFPYRRQETPDSGVIHRGRRVPGIIDDRGRLVKTQRLGVARPVNKTRMRRLYPVEGQAYGYNIWKDRFSQCDNATDPSGDLESRVTIQPIHNLFSEFL